MTFMNGVIIRLLTIYEFWCLYIKAATVTGDLPSKKH